MIHVDLIWFYFFFSKREHSLRKWWNRWLSHYEVGLADRVGRNCSSRLIVYLVLPSFFFFSIEPSRNADGNGDTRSAVRKSPATSFSRSTISHTHTRIDDGDLAMAIIVRRGRGRRGVGGGRGRRPLREAPSLRVQLPSTDRVPLFFFLSFFLSVAIRLSVSFFLPFLFVCCFFFSFDRPPCFWGTLLTSVPSEVVGSLYRLLLTALSLTATHSWRHPRFFFFFFFFFFLTLSGFLFCTLELLRTDARWQREFFFISSANCESISSRAFVLFF